MAYHLDEVVDFMGIKDKIGWLTLDNHGANDLAVESLFRRLDPTMTRRDGQAKKVERRCRCWGHIINLTVQAFLVGDSKKQLDTLEGIERKVAVQEFTIWKRKGPIRRAHNICVFIRASPKRREEFQKMVHVYGHDSDLDDFDLSSFLDTLDVFINNEDNLQGAMAPPPRPTGPMDSQQGEDLDHELMVRLEQETRWNSTFLMIQRVLRLRQAIHHFCVHT